MLYTVSILLQFYQLTYYMNEPQTLEALGKMFTEKFQAESTHPNKSVRAFLDQGVKTLYLEF